MNTKKQQLFSYFWSLPGAADPEKLFFVSPVAIPICEGKVIPWSLSAWSKIWNAINNSMQWWKTLKIVENKWNQVELNFSYQSVMQEYFYAAKCCIWLLTVLVTLPATVRLKLEADVNRCDACTLLQLCCIFFPPSLVVCLYVCVCARNLHFRK